jgi:hypothetical protein
MQSPTTNPHQALQQAAAGNQQAIQAALQMIRGGNAEICSALSNPIYAGNRFVQSLVDECKRVGVDMLTQQPHPQQTQPEDESSGGTAVTDLI